MVADKVNLINSLKWQRDHIAGITDGRWGQRFPNEDCGLASAAYTVHQRDGRNPLPTYGGLHGCMCRTVAVLHLT